MGLINIQFEHIFAEPSDLKARSKLDLELGQGTLDELIDDEDDYEPSIAGQLRFLLDSDNERSSSPPAKPFFSMLWPKSEASESYTTWTTMKTLAYVLAFATLLALIGYGFSQALNKDETKHEYGIAFPLEDTESRLPAPSVIAEVNATKMVSAGPTTTTETVPTSALGGQESTSSNENGKDIAASAIAMDDVVVDSVKDDESDGDKDESDGPISPNLFIQRLMGITSLRAQMDGPSMDSQESGVEEKKKPEEGESIENLENKWNNRLKKFSRPFENTYSLFVRASKVMESPMLTGSVGEVESAEQNKDRRKPIAEPDSSNEVQSVPNIKYYLQTSNSLEQPSKPSSNDPANQLLRLYALSMMSKLFSTLRSQMVYNLKDEKESDSKMDSAVDDEPNLDDSEDDNGPDTITLPIVIGNRPRPETYPFASEENQIPVRSTAMMYGRPSANRFYPQGPLSPLASLLSAVSRQPNYRRLESPVAESQPQRLILFITRASGSSDMPRQEDTSSQSASQPNMAYYSPLSAPSSPVYYHYSPQASSSVARPQVVEVPVPVYVPVVRMPRRVVSVPKPNPMMSLLQSRIDRSPASSGNVALIYMHHPQAQQQEQVEHRTIVQTVPTPDPSSYSESQAEHESPSASGIVRIMLRARPTMMASAESSPMVSRFAFHRRIDEAEDEPQANFYNAGRLRQWRDYNQNVQTNPLAHLLVSDSARQEEPEGSVSVDEQPMQHQQYYYSDQFEHQMPQPSQAVPSNHAGHAAFFVLADHSAGQPESHEA